MLNENRPELSEQKISKCEKQFTTYEYDNGLRKGRRTPKLYLAKGKDVSKFEGGNIEGFCAISTQKYTKQGKWSNTVYSLLLAKGVKPIYFLDPLHGEWGDNTSSWGEIAERLNLPVDTIKELVKEEYPRTAKRLDDIEEFALVQETAEKEIEVVIVSFGSPTHRAIAEGYWENEKSSVTSDGQTVTVAPNPDWRTPVITEPKDAKIISTNHTRGMHGGYWNIEVAVPSESENK